MIRLRDTEADLLAAIVSRRQRVMVGNVDEIREFTVREFVAIGLAELAQSEGVWACLK